MKNAASRVTPPRSGNQPGQSSTLKIYGANTIPTIRVKLKDSDDDRELTINQSDFDPDRYVRSD